MVSYIGMGSANEKRRYDVTPSPIGLAHAMSGPCMADKISRHISRLRVSEYSSKY